MAAFRDLGATMAYWGLGFFWGGYSELSIWHSGRLGLGFYGLPISRALVGLQTQDPAAV